MGVNKKRLITIIALILLMILIIVIVIIGVASYKYIMSTNSLLDSLTLSENLELSSGNYYLNGDKNNCFFEVTDSTIQLKGNKEQFKLMYDTIDNPQITFEDWYTSKLKQWNIPKEYDVIVQYKEKRVAWNMNYDESGNLLGYNFDIYIDENAFKYNSNYFIKT